MLKSDYYYTSVMICYISLVLNTFINIVYINIWYLLSEQNTIQVFVAAGELK